METLGFTRPPSPEFIKSFSLQNGVDPEIHYGHPPEDYLLISDREPIFAVADGVTLRVALGEPYPNPSGAAEASKVFCESVVGQAEPRYASLNTGNLPEIFRAANTSIGALNEKRGLSPEQLNYWDRDLFSTTGAFAIVRANELLWGTICDSYVVLYGPTGKVKFQSPPCYEFDTLEIAGWEELDEKQRHIAWHRLARNSLSDQKQPIGYGVANGQPSAESYFHHGSLATATGDILLLLTDGFEHYIGLPEFWAIFKDWPSDLEQRLIDLRERYTTQDPSKYGREATLIAVRNF